MKKRFRALAIVPALLLAGVAVAQTPAPPPATKAAKKPTAAPTRIVLEQKAVDILKASSARLAAAKSMAFTVVVSYESPSRLGPPLVYATRSQVTLQRPDKLKVVTLGDGPPSEFYYDGKTMLAFAPAENLVAFADAPPTIDAALYAAYASAAVYFPFTDMIVTDPYKAIADSLKVAFYIGQSKIVGGTTTDMVAYVAGNVFVQVWIGAEDRLPRRVDAVYLNDRARLRHVMELSDWDLDAAVPGDAFMSAKAAGAPRIAFARPEAKAAPAAKPRPKSAPAKAPAAKTQ